MRGEKWRDLIDHLLSDDTSVEEELGFSLLMVELCSCTSCNSYSFRAIRGCTTCATSTIQRYRGSDEELISRHQEKTNEMRKHLATKKVERK